MAKIGPQQGLAGSYELEIYDHIQPVTPAAYGVQGAVFDPKQYFITSGDAVSKTKFLIRELTTYAASITEDGPWRAATQQALVGAQAMLDYLLQARGDAIFCETEHVDHKLLVIPKNPRIRDDAK